MNRNIAILIAIVIIRIIRIIPYKKGGGGYSIVDGNVEISKERMQKIYEKYRDLSVYDAWKKQLEDAAKHKELYKPKITSASELFNQFHTR
jgi:hypothetical protein